MTAEATRTWSPWRTVVAFGLVSLAADMVYEGMRSVAGPFLGSLGASALVVGVVTGAGEAIALMLRLVVGPAADRSGNHWAYATSGYALTAVAVPLLALTPFLGSAGLAVACLLILAERTGKAVRSPSKSALLAGMAAPVGRGRGFAVHKALDQVGAFAGPLLVAGVAAVAGGRIWLGFAILAVPGAASLVLLAELRRKAPIEVREVVPAPTTPHRLPKAFWMFSVSCAASTAGLMTFGVMSFALVDAGHLSLVVVPVVYAAAMAVEAVGALGSGFSYDRLGGRVLYALPVLVAPIPLLVFGGGLGAALVGIALWGLATGVQDSTVKALVADLVPRHVLGTAYGVFATAQGLAALVGGVLAGWLYADHLPVLVGFIAALQVISLATLVPAVRQSTSPST
jgi:MFS family permease